MTFNLTIQPNEEYYKESYSQLISLTKFRKFQPLAATMLILVGCTLFYFDKKNILGMFPLVFIVFGLYEFFSFYNEKKKWLKDRGESKINGKTLEFEFCEDVIKHSGPFSTGEIAWTGLKTIIKTKKGIVLKPENGMSIYLSDKFFKEQKEIDFIMSKKQ